MDFIAQLEVLLICSDRNNACPIGKYPQNADFVAVKLVGARIINRAARQNAPEVDKHTSFEREMLYRWTKRAVWEWKKAEAENYLSWRLTSHYYDYCYEASLFIMHITFTSSAGVK